MKNNYSRELYELHRYVTSSRIARLRHVQAMNEEDVLKRIMKCTPEGKKAVEEPDYKKM